VKESDRIAAMAAGLRGNGVTVEDGPDWWTVTGLGAGGVPGGGLCLSHLDHRIAMSFLILGMAAKAPVRVDDGGPIMTSFPIFEALMGALGADLAPTAA
jgi:3-phosphoshikimate 1-carboxyvinyltransferase